MKRGMGASPLSADAPVWRRHSHADGYAYGWLLLLILGSLGFQLGAPDEGWARALTIVFQSVTVLACLHVSGAHRWLIRAASVAIVLAVLGAGGVAIGSHEVGVEAARTISFMLVLLAPAAIVVGIVRQARAEGAITIRTMFGVLCVYLLIGQLFAFSFAVVESIGDKNFFAEIKDGTPADFLYFSFATLTTTGYGDLTAAFDLGRSLAITEALIGQIYLVTVVALIVSNLSMRARSETR
jgi:hypothetical protein